MTNAIGPNGSETHIRTVVFREGDLYIAQCLEYDISTQAADITTLLERLDVTVDAECAMCADVGKSLADCIQPAPNYFHSLWEKRSVSLSHLQIPLREHLHMEVALAQAA